MGTLAIIILSFLGGAIVGIIVMGLCAANDEEYGRGYEHGYERGVSDATWDLHYKGDKEI